MATHSSLLAWRIPGTGEPGGLPSVGLHRVGHDWSNLAVAAGRLYFMTFLVNFCDCCMVILIWLAMHETWVWSLGWEIPLEKGMAEQIQPVHPKGDQSWVFIGRTDAEAETPILWPPHSKSWLIGRDPDAGRDWGQEEKGMTEDEMAGWHHQLDGHEFE